MDLKQAGTGPSRRHIQGSKIAKRLPSVKYSFTVLENRKFFENFFWKNYILKNGPSGAPGLASASPWRAKVSQCRKSERGDPLRFFNIHSVAKHEKIEEKIFFHFREKNLTMPKKTERGDPLRFFNIHSVAKHQKNAGGTLWGKKFWKKNSEKKCLAVPKKIERGGSLVSPGLVCYAEKQVKPFWFSSLDQIVHFGAIIFCRTFVELFWSVLGYTKNNFAAIIAFKNK